MAFKCNQCELKFNYQFKAIMHQFSHMIVPATSFHDVNKENKSECLCDLCGLLFLNLDHLNNHHYAQHLEERDFVCGQCKKTFKTEARYIYHIQDRTVHLNDYYKCSLCSKQLSDKKNLQRHIKLHTRETKFACGTCHKPFVTKAKLDFHEKTHSPDFRCNICQETFKSKVILCRHHRSVHGNELFKCSECPKKYSKKGHLKAHMRSHEANFFQAQSNTFQCNECGKAFRSNGNLNFHQRSHK